MEGAFYWNACPQCVNGRAKAENRTLLRCGGCRLVWYCSREHQRAHWTRHAPLCRAAATVQQPTAVEDGGVGVQEEEDVVVWRRRRVASAAVAEVSLGRALTPFERQMFLLPRACEVCKAVEAPVECARCRCVCYCGDAHLRSDASRHADACAQLRLCRRLDLGDAASLAIPQEPTPQIQSEDAAFPRSMRELLAGWGLCQEEVVATCSELMSCPLTLLHVLLLARARPFLRPTLQVHVVGAGALEGNSFAWELLLHRLPVLQHLCFAFIGPHAQLPAPEELCADCQSKGRSVEMESYKPWLYHDYCLSDSYSEPDIIIAFNCGFLEYNESETDSWNKSMPFFFQKPQILLVFTSYTHTEAEKDFEIVKSFSGNNVEVLLEKEENPFSSLQPHRDWDSYRSCVFYFNKFISVFLVND